MFGNPVRPDIPESNKRDEHVRVLQEAVENAREFGTPVGGRDVRAAINYFAICLNRTGSINLFEYGMREGRMDCLIEGLALLKKHLGP